MHNDKSELIEEYTHGYCFELALYVHKLDPKRFIIYGLKQDRNRKYVDHYFIKDKKENIAIDAYGRREDASLSSILEPWGNEFNASKVALTGPYTSEKAFWRSFTFQPEIGDSNKPKNSLRREAFDTGWETKAKEAAAALSLLK